MTGTHLLVPYATGSYPPRLIAESARKRGSEPLFIVENSDKGSAELFHVAKFPYMVVDRLDPHVIMTKLPKGLHARGIVTFAESAVRVTAELGWHLGLVGLSPHSARLLTDKLLQREALRNADLAAPRSWEVRPGVVAARLEAYKELIMKPATGGGSRDTVRIHDGHSLQGALQIVRESDERFVVETAIASKRQPAPWGDYVQAEYLVHGDQPTLVGLNSKLPPRPPFIERGSVLPTHLDREAAIEVDLVGRRAISALGIHDGVACIELMLTEAGPVVIEVNGRMGAWIDRLLRSAYDLSLGDLAVGQALGEDVPERADVHQRQRLNEIWVEYELIPPCGATLVKRDLDVRAIRKLQGVVSVTPKLRTSASLNRRQGLGTSLGLVLARVRDERALGQLARDLDEVAEGTVAW